VTDRIKTEWWKVFNDLLLNFPVEEQVSLSNQSLAQAEAQYRQARGTGSGGAKQIISRNFRLLQRPAVPGSREAIVFPERIQQTNIRFPSTPLGRLIYGDVCDARWSQGTASAQATRRRLQALRLSIQAELANKIISSLRTLDAQKKTLDDTVIAYQKALELTKQPIMRPAWQPKPTLFWLRHPR